VNLGEEEEWLEEENEDVDWEKYCEDCCFRLSCEMIEMGADMELCFCDCSDIREDCDDFDDDEFEEWDEDWEEV